MSVTTEKVVVQVSVDGQVTLVSSVSSALGAASSAAVAQAAAAAALISETNADASEAAAAVSAAAALVSEGNADTSEANAAASAAAALISEGNADASAGAAATSASDALTSANNADVSEAAAAASAAAALVSQNAAAASAASAATATETLVEGGTLDASFASIKSSGDIVLAGTKKFYVDGVGGVGGDTYISESSANTLDFFAGAANTLKLTAAGAAILGTLAASGESTFTRIGDTTGSTIVLANASANTLESYSASASADQKRWGWQAGSNIGDGVYRLRAFNDARTSGINAISISRSGIASVALTLGGNTSVTGTFSSSDTATALRYLISGTAPTASGNQLSVYNSGLWLGTAAATHGWIAVAGTEVAYWNTQGLSLLSTGKLYLDNGGDTYLVESSANVLDLYAGGVNTLRLNASGATVAGTLSASGATRIGSGTAITSAGRDYLTIGGTQLGSVAFKNGSDAVVAYMQSGAANFDIFANTGGTLRLGANGTDGLAILSSTGLAVTGTLSATGTMYARGYTVSPLAGVGVEIDYGAAGAGIGRVLAYDRTGATAKSMRYDALDHTFKVGAALGTTAMALTSGGNIAIGSTAKLYLDGTGGTGDTYLVESSANVLDIYAGGVKTLSLATTGATVTGSVTASANALIAGGVRIDPSSGVTKAWLYRDTSAADRYYFASNWVGSQENLAYPSWGVLLDSRVAGDVLQIRRAPAGGAMATIASFSSTGVTVTGIVDASDVVSTSGGVGLRLRYGTTDFLNIFGSMYSSGATMLGYGVRSSTAASNSFLSTSAAASHPRGALTMDNALRFWQATASSIAVDSAATLTENFTITTLGDMVTPATKKHYLDGASGAGGDTYLVESSANVLDTYVGGVNTLKSTPILTTVTGALSAPDLTVTVVDKTIFSATIVDTFLYDTSKDSDGGAWRKRCAHRSWEAETLSGNWLGSAANEAAARAISGATTGSYYYDTTALGFYTLNAGSGKTATYRGNVRQFPAKVLITVEAARVVLWDLTQAGCPMWMVFLGVGSASGIIPTESGYANAVYAVNGVMALALIAGSVNSAQAGVVQIKFVQDAVYRHTIDANYSGRWVSNLSLRNNSTPTTASWFGTVGYVVNNVCNDVAMTVLPNAPVDVATGLPVPTIAVATAGGVSVIKDDGTVVNSADTGAEDSIVITRGGDIFVGYVSSNAVRYARNIKNLAASWAMSLYYISSIPAHSNVAEAPNCIEGSASEIYVGLASKVAITHENPAVPASGMVAYITKDYNSGWQVGAIKGAWLANTVAETLTGAELVTNGTFATDTAGWTTGNSATFVQSGGAAVLTNGAASNGYAYQAITTVAGKTYVVRGDLTLGTATGPRLTAGTTTQGAELGVAQLSASGVFNLTFTATGTTTYITAFTNSVTSGHTATYDNISCRLADVDRSVKAKGLQAFGSLTKAAVASGAALMGYSGFSAANYLEQPYNSDLDFGTGDFCIMGWLKETPNGVAEVVCQRTYYTGAAYSGAAIQLVVNASGTLRADITDDGFSSQDTFASTAVVDDSVWRLVWLIRRGSYFELWFNGTKAATDAAVVNANTSLSNASATLRMGYMTGGTNPLMSGTLALWRISATAPSAEQIKHIYETEKALFEANAACTLAGSSNAVTALAYDEETDLLHVGTSYGRSAFKGLVRVSSEATPVGAITALAAGGGFIAQGGASGADIYIPAYTLREELSRRAEQAARLASALELITFTATASQTAFQLAVGLTPKYAYRNGLLLREGTTEDYAVGFDGFRWTVTLADASVSGDHITVMGVRSNG